MTETGSGKREAGNNGKAGWVEAYTVIISGAVEGGWSVTEGDLEGVPAVNGRTRGEIRHTRTRDRSAVWEPTGDGRGDDEDGAWFRGGGRAEVAG